MPIEVERKFLLCHDDWRTHVAHSERMIQGYLISAQAIAHGYARASVRVRCCNGKAWLTIKAAQVGVERAEYELSVSPNEADEMLVTLCQGVVEKTRHRVLVDTALFEIDEFHGANAGLVVAEIELTAADAVFPRPSWLGLEVTALPRYYNSHLVTHPYNTWSPAEREAKDGVRA